MHPLKQLRKLMQDRPNNHAKVVSVVGREVVLATSRGSKTLTLTPGDATRYQPGDAVRLENNQVVGRRSRSPTVYVV